MPKATVAVLISFLSGCALSYEECHESPLLAIYATKDGRSARAVRPLAPVFEDSIVLMSDDFGVPLHEVIPVRVYVDGDRGKSHYNRITRSIVLRGPSDPEVFAHELSHLFTHHIVGSPPYWCDQALAEYMEERFGSPGAVAASGGTPAADRRSEAAMRARRLIRRIAEARDPSEVLAHLTPEAVDEDRGWGMIVVRYLFESRWSGRSVPEKIRGLLRLTSDDVAACAPEILEYCRRPELAAEGGQPSRAVGP